MSMNHKAKTLPKSTILRLSVTFVMQCKWPVLCVMGIRQVHNNNTPPTLIIFNIRMFYIFRKNAPLLWFIGFLIIWTRLLISSVYSSSKMRLKGSPIWKMRFPHSQVNWQQLMLSMDGKQFMNADEGTFLIVITLPVIHLQLLEKLRLDHLHKH